MDVQLPDGKTLKGVPDGTSRTDILKRLEDSGYFDTQLTSTEEENFQQWKKINAPKDSGVDYDLRGAFKAGLQPAANGHWSDRFKKPNHKTFSAESQYAAFGTPGTWQGSTYIPGGAEINIEESPGAMSVLSNETKRGIANLAGLPVDLTNIVSNVLGADINKITGKETTYKDLTDFPGGGEWMQNKAEELGLIDPKATPQNWWERLLGVILQAAPQAALSPANAGRALVAQTAGAGAGELTGEMGGGPVSQTLANLLGMFATHGVPVSSITREGLTKGTDVEKNVADQKAAGITSPSAGTVSKSKTMQGIENLLVKLFGSSGYMEEQAARREAGVGGKVGDIVKKLAPKGADNIRAGNVMKTGASNWIDNTFKTVQDRLYGKVAALVPKNTPIKISEFQKYLTDATKEVPGAEPLMRTLIPAQLKEYSGKLGETLTEPASVLVDAEGHPLIPETTKNTLPFEATDALRKKIGERIQDALIAKDANAASLRKMYAALTTDIENSLPASARQAWARARRYTRAGHDRIDNVLQPLMDKHAPEDALKFALRNTKDGATALRSVMRSLKPEEFNEARAYVIENLGKAKVQNFEQSRFSFETFATNWKNLHKDVRKVLFPDTKTQQAMDNVARIAIDYRDAGRTLFNTSGTAKSSFHIAQGASFITALFTGNFGVAGGIAADAAFNAATARAISHPLFIQWLSEAASASPALFPQYVARLTTLANKAGSPEEQEDYQILLDYAKASIKGKLQ